MNLLSVIAASRRRGGAFDADAADYFARIVTAGSTISEANKTAVNAFIVGCKDDLIWSAIKASCILAGADTLAGALVPLVGPAPTNNGPFGAGDYSRTTGLVGNGSKYLNSNRNNNADPKDSKHIAAYVTNSGSLASAVIGARQGTEAESGSSQIIRLAAETNFRIHSATTASSAVNVGVGLVAVSRSSSTEINWRHGGIYSGSSSITSETPFNRDIDVFRRSGSGGNAPTNARLSFYSIGENLNLAQLDARLTTLMGAIT